jgi:hypothetical protein
MTACSLLQTKIKLWLFSGNKIHVIRGGLINAQGNALKTPPERRFLSSNPGIITVMHKIVFMKQLFIIAAVIGIVTGCKKADSTNPVPGDPQIAGNWKMVSIKNNNTNTTTYEPSDPKYSYNVMTFSYIDAATLYMDGHTYSNAIWGNYALTKNEHTLAYIPGSGGVTQAGETSWGELFYFNIIPAKSYFFHTNDSLFINAGNNQTMAFTRQ